MAEKKLRYPYSFFENHAWQKKQFVCGIDEVGRGCLAGPVVVASCILPINAHHELLIDSKELDEGQREKAYAWLIKRALWSTALASHRIIDERNILQATALSMRRSYYQLVEKLPWEFEKLRFVVIDSVPLVVEKSYLHPNLEFFNFNYGESISPSIAGASIIAKVTRDRLMNSMSKFFPAYALEKNKGYATREHIANLQKQGPSIIHREKFVDSLLEEKKPEDKQALLF